VNCRIAVLSLGSVLFLSGSHVGAHDRVEIQVRGYYYVEPATVQVLVTVEPDAHNRILRIQADGEGMFRSSEVELVGDAEKRLHTIQFKNLSAGMYKLRAEVLSSSETVIASAEHELVVTGR
jgi:hypothetical protein